MASVAQFGILRDALVHELGHAIAAGICDATEALMLIEDALIAIEEDHDVKFPGARLAVLAEKLMRMAQERRL